MPRWMSNQAIMSDMKELPDLTRAVVPVAYPRLLLEVLADYGIEMRQALAGTGILPVVLEDVDARISPFQFAQLVMRGEQLSGSPALGYEMGWRMNLTSHGDLGQALMASSNLEQALTLAERFLPLRSMALSMSHHVEHGRLQVLFGERFDLGPLRRFSFESLLVGLSRAGRLLDGNFDLQVDCDWAEPAYHVHWRERLPFFRFNQARLCVSLPAHALSFPLLMADSVAARTAILRCEREMSVFDTQHSTAERVRLLLQGRRGDYPDLETAAQRLLLSARTLKRRLQEEGESYQALLDAVRMQEAKRLLLSTGLRLEEIAALVGYANPANFSRAFRKWSGQPPSVYRQQQAAERGPQDAEPAL